MLGTLPPYCDLLNLIPPLDYISHCLHLSLTAWWKGKINCYCSDLNGVTPAIEAAYTVCYVNDHCVDVIFVNVAVVAAVIVTAAVADADYVDVVVYVDNDVTVFILSSLSGKKSVFFF